MNHLKVIKVKMFPLSVKDWLNVLLAIVVLVFGSSNVVARADEISDFKKTALKKWTEQFSNVDKYSCRITLKSSDLPPSEYEFTMCYPSNLIERRGKKNITIECNNSRYGFSLLKSVTEKEWKIEGIYRHERRINRQKDWKFRKEGDYSPELMQNGLFLMETTSNLWTQIYPTMNLPCLFQDEDFIVSNLKHTTNEKGVKIVKFNFSYPVDKMENYMKIEGGVIELNEHDYSILRIEHMGGTVAGSKTEIELEYDEGAFPFPAVKRQLLKMTKNGKLLFEEETSYSFKMDDSLSEDRFTLSYYGIPEPKFEDDSKFDVRWYFLIGGCFFIALAVLITRRRRSEPERQDADDVLAG